MADFPQTALAAAWRLVASVVHHLFMGFAFQDVKLAGK
jgi:hypothetical protein